MDKAFILPLLSHRSRVMNEHVFTECSSLRL